ncbi:uncharacterized protein LOC131006120 [Salvia miltiorrhiza]|uniref:uncharacterized protein LOC131006120 n=1 Tax=Salvia miltiorrhiza TaxID=226208 RepID=UPI0025ABACE6|nr:uncharacterized protein LOC131006120 [Salvia miltiorrhiza]
MSASFVSSESSSENSRSSDDDTSCLDTVNGVPRNRPRAGYDVVMFDYGIGVNLSGPLEGSIPAYKLGNESPKSVITFDKLDELRAVYAIPPCASLAAPSGSERPDWLYPGWTVLYECFLQMGARFPLPRLVFEACTHYRVAPGQLVPNVWRTLMAIQVFSELRGVHFSFSEVLQAYSLETHRTDNVRYQFKANRPLVLSLPDSAKKWRSRYFFISNNALGEPRDSIIPQAWEACTCPRRGPTSLAFDSASKIDWFLGFSEEDRQICNILTEANLRVSSLWSRVPADHRMSKSYVPPLLGKGAAMDVIRRNRQKAASSSGAVTADVTAARVPHSTRVPAHKKKRSAEVDLTLSDRVDDDPVNLSFPNVSAHAQLGPVRGVAEQLLLPRDRDYLKEMGSGSVASELFDHAFLSLQKAAFLMERTGAMEAELRELRAERENWKGEMTAVKKTRDEARQVVKKLESAKLEDARRLERAVADCKELEAKVVALEQQVLYKSCETEVRVRGEMALAYLENQPPKTWDVQQYIDEFNEWKAGREEQAAELASNLVGMTTEDDHP